MAFEPKIGLVIRYDFLWKTEHDPGRAHGVKDRPCAVVLLSQMRTDGSRLVVVCPITHTPPHHEKEAVEIPHKVAQHLGLDDQRSWIITNTVNIFTCEHNRVPFGVSQTLKASGRMARCPMRSGSRYSTSSAPTAASA